ncbi:hypothetical protein GYA25_03635 [Candidatus Woesearchaeota archaeon]|nr:hypothetical protein [Candidatus Woesearchaeota archaeon]
MVDVTSSLKAFLSDAILPLLLVWALIFAILEKVKFFGENKKQLNAIISLVIGLIFSFSVFPKLVVGNLILFLAVSLVALFVILLLWGFIFGTEKEGFKPENWMKLSLAVIFGIAFIGAIFWATGWNKKLGSLVSINLSNPIFLNIVFVIIIAVVLALFMSQGKK